MVAKGRRRSGQPSGGGIAPTPKAPAPAAKRPGGGASGQRPAQSIPPAVANRMARRIAIATGVPTLLGMATFVVSYLLVSRAVLDIPPAVTLLTSGGFFLLGVLGLSYGVLSASWEDAAGSLLGFEQIGVNVARLRSAFRRPQAGG
ncbi:MAG: hypothetical protein RLZZ124_1744 [Cyanobacteriota bacterium]